MGSSLNSDKDAKLYVTLSKRVYIAGEMVEGSAHINCSAHRPYRLLNLLLEGEEEIDWGEQTGDFIRHYTNQRKTYFC
jgi:hypothetical protein